MNRQVVVVHPAAAFGAKPIGTEVELRLFNFQLAALERAVDAYFDWHIRMGNIRRVRRLPGDPSMLGFAHPDEAFLWRIKKLAIAANHPADAASRINGESARLVARILESEALRNQCRKPKRKKKKPSTSR